ncbi:glyoxylase-like metal-dependent hydrolase (beta-lactamase superfamily II) [Actinoalloteichus hoggarensis]|uniref:Putative metallo-hydrolase n=1 Tax=Actinoalloteichus hoggarensis TaxID=1470176 RepID=A0A221W1R0_9PSEU|nr:MBL fold metallo-hydrolase [Actinoalloteichus hoggarensis]ASO19775.1 putative metallo-hydrolase [Actinoalloteichus hoggarensis]MBB5919518.1 glyoxylase-like metal-dependent hydrolase (beta-lactamase superfamily II) [Actinoalloteichus hoggarensis]
MTARIEHVVTSGVFSLDGQDFDVDNNVWLIGDDAEIVVVDPSHDPAAVERAVAGRRVTAVVCTHGHNDHVNGSVALGAALDAPVLLHPADRELWDQTHPGVAPGGDLTDGQVLTVAGTELHVLATPGHTWGSVSLYAPALSAVFTGDTLFEGGPGATGRSFSDFPTIIASIRDRLLTLPAETVVHTGHGDRTTIGAEAPALPAWIARGH